ncbi:MAG: DUF2314 domain-containing protein [Armatimonadetes bacterium]|nr:DUF2314 domain-containing protein [Armatimonadota bacterium]
MLGRWLAAGSAVVAGVASVSGLCAKGSHCDRSSSKLALCPATANAKSCAEQAKRGIASFLRDLRAPRPSQEYFSVSVAGSSVGDKRNSVWVDGLTCNGQTLEGRLVGRVSRPVRFPVSAVNDWIVVENGRPLGGYTLRD